MTSLKPLEDRKEKSVKKPKKHTTGHASSAKISDDNKTLLLQSTYTTPILPGSFSAVQNLRRYTGEPLSETVQYLSKQDAYTLH